MAFLCPCRILFNLYRQMPDFYSSSNSINHIDQNIPFYVNSPQIVPRRPDNVIQYVPPKDCRIQVSVEPPRGTSRIIVKPYSET